MIDSDQSVLTIIRERMEEGGFEHHTLDEYSLGFLFSVGSSNLTAHWIMREEPWLTLQVIVGFSPKNYYLVRARFDEYLNTGKIRFQLDEESYNWILVWVYSLPVSTTESLSDTIDFVMLEAREEIDRILPAITFMQEGITEPEALRIIPGILERSSFSLPIYLCPGRVQ